MQKNRNVQNIVSDRKNNFLSSFKRKADRIIPRQDTYSRKDQWVPFTCPIFILVSLPFLFRISQGRDEKRATQSTAGQPLPFADKQDTTCG